MSHETLFEGLPPLDETKKAAVLAAAETTLRESLARRREDDANEYISAEGAIFKGLDRAGIENPADRANYTGKLLGQVQELRNQIRRTPQASVTTESHASLWARRLAEQNPSTHASRTQEDEH